MTIESNISKNMFAGNGQTTIFPFTYKIWKTDEIKVTIEDEKGITSSITPFAVTINKNGGGEVVLYLDDENKTPIPTGYTIALTRNMPFLQEQDYLNGGRFNAEVIEDNFDIACAERQQLKEVVERTIQIPPTSGTKPEKLLNEIFDAKNTAVEQAGVAAAKAQISTEQAALSGSYAQSASEQAVLSQEYASTAKAWAESDTPPDPTDENSKSAKTWAMIAADVVPFATDILPGKVSPQYPLVTDDLGKLTYDGYTRGWGAKDNFLSSAVIQSNVDLNTVLDNGFYSVNAGNISLNRPSANPLMLQVNGGNEPQSDNITVSRKIQIAYDLLDGQIYTRLLNSDTWTNWLSISWTEKLKNRLTNSSIIRMMLPSLDTTTHISIPLPPSDTPTKYTPPINGWIYVRIVSRSAAASINCDNHTYNYKDGGSGYASFGVLFPVQKDNEYDILVYYTDTEKSEITFIPCIGELENDLY